jgi:hypothetical protein
MELMDLWDVNCQLFAVGGGAFEPGGGGGGT